MLDYRTWKKKRNLEAQHKYLDDACSIDAQLNEARSKINWKRRKEAEAEYNIRRPSGNSSYDHQGIQGKGIPTGRSLDRRSSEEQGQ